MICSICLEPINFNLFQLKCKHIYHKECIKSWYLKGDSGKNCPDCRKYIYGKSFKNWDYEREEVRRIDLWELHVNEIMNSYNSSLDHAQKYPGLYGFIGWYILHDIMELEWIFNNCEITDSLNDFHIQLEYIKHNTDFQEFPNFDSMMFIGDHQYNIIANRCSYTSLNNSKISKSLFTFRS